MRYSRQEVLEWIGPEGQKRINNAHIAIVGIGALGTVAADLLSRAGIGHLTLIDHDLVDLSNLQRQSLFTEQDVNKSKAESAKSHLIKINSEITIEAKAAHVSKETISSLINNPNIILDCTDNIPVRLIIDDYATKIQIPWIHAAAIKDIGTVKVFLPKEPSFSDIFPQIKSGESCESAGIINATSHIIASLQVTEALKIILGKESTTELMRLNLLEGKIEKYKVNTEKKKEIIKEESDDLFIIETCDAKKGFRVRPTKEIKINLTNIKNNPDFEIEVDTPIALIVKKEGKSIVIHSYGELLFENETDKNKITQMANIIYQNDS